MTITQHSATKTLPPADAMFRAVVERDASFEGVFFVAVRTTGIFCRPTCTARKPLRKNVEFFATAAASLHAGYRPCKVCRPTEDNAEPPPWVRELLRTIETSPPDARIRDGDLRDRSIDPARARRYFQRHYGMTFQAYQRARRLSTAIRDIRDGGPLATAPFRNGYHSDSGFRDAFTKLFGDPPSRSEDIACLCAHWVNSPLGSLLIVAGDRGICLLEFVDRRALEQELKDIRERFRAAIVPGKNRHIEQISEELAEYFDGRRTTFTAPLDARGTPFQETVWNALREIPHGETRSYSSMAAVIGRPGAQRAVGRANGQNRIAIVIPCHRVVRENGELSGYGGGVWRKQWLLDHERGEGSDGVME